MNIGSPPWTLSPTASRDLIMKPHKAVRHYWRRGQGIQSSSEPTGSLLRYDICFMVSFDIASIYAKIVWSSIKINKLSDVSNSVSDRGVVTENHTTTSSRVIMLMDGKFNWMVKSWSKYNNFFAQENDLENVYRQMAAIYSRCQCVKSLEQLRSLLTNFPCLCGRRICYTYNHPRCQAYLIATVTISSDKYQVLKPGIEKHFVWTESTYLFKYTQFAISLHDVLFLSLTLPTNHGNSKIMVNIYNPGCVTKNQNMIQV